jgi:DNA invertase Pin-like site-specific DNA recombinase
MKIVGYCRTSCIEEGSRSVRPVDEQEAILRAYARAHGHSLQEVYRDTGIASGSDRGSSDRSTRAGLMTLLDAMGEAWDAVVVLSLDRLAARDLSFDVVQELRENGKRVLVVGTEAPALAVLAAREPPPREAACAPVDDDGDPETRRRSIAERLLRGREAGARAGKHQSGPAPFGYRRDYGTRATEGVLLRIDDVEADVVRFIFREYLRVRSMKRLIELLEENRCRTRRGKRWSRAGVSWILKNDTYVGRVHFGSIRTKGRHDPIVPPIIFNKVQKLIRENNKRRKAEVNGSLEAAVAPAESPASIEASAAS